MDNQHVNKISDSCLKIHNNQVNFQERRSPFDDQGNFKYMPVLCPSLVQQVQSENNTALQNASNDNLQIKSQGSQDNQDAFNNTTVNHEDHENQIQEIDLLLHNSPKTSKPNTKLEKLFLKYFQSLYRNNQINFRTENGGLKDNSPSKDIDARFLNIFQGKCMCEADEPVKDNQCIYSHSQSEINFHPIVYKATMCEFVSEKQDCPNSVTNSWMCPNAHSIYERDQMRNFQAKIVQNLNKISNSLPLYKNAQFIQLMNDFSIDSGSSPIWVIDEEDSKQDLSLKLRQSQQIHGSGIKHRKSSDGEVLNAAQTMNNNFESPVGNKSNKRKQTMDQTIKSNRLMLKKEHSTQGSTGTNNSKNKSQKFKKRKNTNNNWADYKSIKEEQGIPYTPKFLPENQCTEAQINTFGTQNLKQSQCIMSLDLTKFKTEPCTLDPNNHNLKKCPFYHDYKKDRKRPIGTYQSEKCSYIEKNQPCPNGENCDKAHNRVEEFYHPDKYKAKFCSSYLQPNKPCEYGDFCSFAHTEEELSVELIEKFIPDMDFYMFHFKTVWCPYKEDDHDRKLCVYAHNWQDFRRKPQIFNYSSEMCKNWPSSDFITSYTDGCPNHYNCKFSHGWKEQEYHPDYFKERQCTHKEKCDKPHCPYFHSNNDKKKQINKMFNLQPKTRVVNFPTNTYVPYLGNLSVAHKQTSFSKMTTEMNCNFHSIHSNLSSSPDATSQMQNQQNQTQVQSASQQQQNYLQQQITRLQQQLNQIKQDPAANFQQISQSIGSIQQQPGSNNNKPILRGVGQQSQIQLQHSHIKQQDIQQQFQQSSTNHQSQQLPFPATQFMQSVQQHQHMLSHLQQAQQQLSLQQHQLNVASQNGAKSDQPLLPDAMQNMMLQPHQQQQYFTPHTQQPQQQPVSGMSTPFLPIQQQNQNQQQPVMQQQFVQQSPFPSNISASSSCTQPQQNLTQTYPQQQQAYGSMQNLPYMQSQVQQPQYQNLYNAAQMQTQQQQSHPQQQHTSQMGQANGSQLNVNMNYQSQYFNSQFNSNQQSQQSHQQNSTSTLNQQLQTSSNPNQQETNQRSSHDQIIDLQAPKKKKSSQSLGQIQLWTDNNNANQEQSEKQMQKDQMMVNQASNYISENLLNNTSTNNSTGGSGLQTWGKVEGSNTLTYRKMTQPNNTTNNSKFQQLFNNNLVQQQSTNSQPTSEHLSYQKQGSYNQQQPQYSQFKQTISSNQMVWGNYQQQMNNQVNQNAFQPNQPIKPTLDRFNSQENNNLSQKTQQDHAPYLFQLQKSKQMSQQNLNLRHQGNIFAQNELVEGMSPTGLSQEEQPFQKKHQILGSGSDHPKLDNISYNSLESFNNEPAQFTKDLNQKTNQPFHQQSTVSNSENQRMSLNHQEIHKKIEDLLEDGKPVQPQQTQIKNKISINKDSRRSSKLMLDTIEENDPAEKKDNEVCTFDENVNENDSAEKRDNEVCKFLKFADLDFLIEDISKSNTNLSTLSDLQNISDAALADIVQPIYVKGIRKELQNYSKIQVNQSES